MAEEEIELSIERPDSKLPRTQETRVFFRAVSHGKGTFTSPFGQASASCILTSVRRANAMLAARNIYFDDNSTTLSFPHCRWSFYGSDSKQYLGG